MGAKVKPGQEEPPTAKEEKAENKGVHACGGMEDWVRGLVSDTGWIKNRVGCTSQTKTITATTAMTVDQNQIHTTTLGVGYQRHQPQVFQHTASYFVCPVRKDDALHLRHAYVKTKQSKMGSSLGETPPPTGNGISFKSC